MSEIYMVPSSKQITKMRRMELEQHLRLACNEVVLLRKQIVEMAERWDDAVRLSQTARIPLIGKVNVKLDNPPPDSVA